MEKYNKTKWYSNRFESIEKLISFDFIMQDKNIPVSDDVRESIIALAMQTYELNLNLMALVTNIRDEKVQNSIIQLFINYDNNTAYLPLSNDKDINTGYEANVVHYKTNELLFEVDANPNYNSLSFEEVMKLLKSLYRQIIELLRLICIIFNKFDSELEEESANTLYLKTINMMALLKEFGNQEELISEAEISSYEITEKFGLIYKYNK